MTLCTYSVDYVCTILSQSVNVQQVREKVEDAKKQLTAGPPTLSVLVHMRIQGTSRRLQATTIILIANYRKEIQL